MSAVRIHHTLPYATAKTAKIPGEIRVEPEDFRVDELPAYAPSGSGEHLMVRFEKTGLNTPSAVQALARAMGVEPKAAGWAGLKDRHAITTQWATFQGATSEAAAAAQVEGVRVLESHPHQNKLKPGHLKSNRFQLRIRGGGVGEGTAKELLAELSDTGCPNYYGEQRFGRDGDNAERAATWVRGEARPPRDRFQRKFLFSALQSAVFNDWLAQRVGAGALGSALLGDLLRKEDTGGLFFCDDLATDGPRAARFEVSATGPMFGAKMRQPTGPAWLLETEALAGWKLTADDLARHRNLGQGTRRVCRIRPVDWTVERRDGDLDVAFTLPKGAYATVILRELLKQDG